MWRQILHQNLQSLQSDNSQKLAFIDERIDECDSQYAESHKMFRHNMDAANALTEKEAISITERKIGKLREISGEITANINAAKRDKSFFEQNSICVVCKQPITDDHKHEMIL